MGFLASFKDIFPVSSTAGHRGDFPAIHEPQLCPLQWNLGLSPWVLSLSPSGSDVPWSGYSCVLYSALYFLLTNLSLHQLTTTVNNCLNVPLKFLFRSNYCVVSLFSLDPGWHTVVFFIPLLRFVDFFCILKYFSNPPTFCFYLGTQIKYILDCLILYHESQRFCGDPFSFFGGSLTLFWWFLLLCLNLIDLLQCLIW